MMMIIAMPLIASAQTTKPGVHQSTSTRRVVPLVPVGTDLKVRLSDALSSKDSRVGDNFTATVIDPSRFDEARVRGHIRSIVKSGKTNGRTMINLAFDSVELADGRTGTLHGYVTRVYDSKGAAIGLIVGGAGGAGSLAIRGRKELKIESGTEMLVHVTR
jgi:hypothetical protein